MGTIGALLFFRDRLGICSAPLAAFRREVGPPDAFLEPNVCGREAELGAAEHGRSPFGIIANMSAHCMYIAPGPLNRVAEEYAPPAARLHQAVDSAHAPIDRLC